MKALFFSFVLLFTFYFLLFTSARADVSPQPIYGGGQIVVSKGSVSIDKKVADPQSQNTWLDNLTINDPKYQPEDIINFQINITNTGNTEIKTVRVKDVFPNFVSFNSGPGNFDANTKTLSFEANNLKPNEARAFVVTGKVVSASQLPVDLGTICMVNQVTANINDSGVSQDNTLFCVQKEVLGAKNKTKGNSKKGGFPVFPPQDITSTPATGPLTLFLFSLLPLGILGWLLRKYS